MPTRIEHLFITPEGPKGSGQQGADTFLVNASVFFPDAILNGEECCVQVSNTDGETIIERFDNFSGEPEEVPLEFPSEYVDIPRGDSAESGPTMIARVSHVENIILPAETPYFNSN